MRTRLYLVGFVLLMILLACNFPAGLSTEPADTGLIEPTSVSTEPPTETESAPPPTKTIEPPDPLAVLNTYVSLSSVRQRLDGMALTRTVDSTVVTGRELLEWVLVDQQFDDFRVANYSRPVQRGHAEVARVLHIYIRTSLYQQFGDSRMKEHNREE